jgi:ABC-type Fe3+-hydroxamate transport system substrate-binding protein
MNFVIKWIVFAILIVLAFLITACSTAVPVTQNFPVAPDMLKEKCPELKTIQGEKISIVDFTKVVSENYTTYYQCAAGKEAWIDWYQQQKKTWDDVK